ncbi:MAG: hypothetical protein HZC40_01770, partial [Chloroflexi bacterium]|nr:hypothetical protein [Chloroflexota bacterium]
MRIRILLFALLLIALIGCSAPTPIPPTATPLPPTRAPAIATIVPATSVPPTALPATRVPPTPTALPTLTPLSADQLWQRAQTCNCLVVYTMPEAGSNIILKAIESAKKSIRFKMYLFTRDDIQNALIAAAKRGVDVRVLMELNPFGSGGTNVDIFNAMKGTPIKFRWASYDFRFTHEKSMVLDDQVAFIMTHNITASSFNTNREYGVLTARAEVVSEIV